MNILFLMGVYPGIGGVEVVSTMLANKFVELGYNVSICSFESKEENLLERLSTSVDRLVLKRPVFSFKNRAKLHDYIVDRNVNVIIDQWVMPFYVSYLIKSAIKGTSCKVIGVHHNKPDTNNHLKNIEQKILNGVGCSFIQKSKWYFVHFSSRLSLRYTYNFVDRFVVLSKSYIPITKDFIFTKNDIKIISIPNPLTIEDLKDKSSFMPKENEVLYVGRIEFNQKRNDRLIDIWEIIEKKGYNWKLRIVGDGPDKDKLQTLIIEKKLKNVIIEGYKNPMSYYKRAKVLLLTSDYEGFGLVVVEGMKYGVVPIVYGSYETIYDIIENERNGYITSIPFSANLTAEKLTLLMEDEKTYQYMARNAIEISKHFSLDRIVNEWIEQICSIMKD